MDSERLDEVDRTHSVLVSGKLELQKYITLKLEFFLSSAKKKHFFSSSFSLRDQ